MGFLRSYKQLSISVITVGALACALAPTSAEATTIGVTSAGQIIDQGLIDWSSYAPDFSPVVNGMTAAVPGLAGYDLTITEQVGFDFLRVTQGPASWAGNFAEGDPVLYTTGGGPMDFIFSSPVAGFGEQIQAALFGAFTARIEAFNAANASLGFFSVNGESTGDNDNSAVFLGLMSDVRDISRIRLSLTSDSGDPAGGSLGDFAVNNPLVTASPVPEPATLVLFGTGLALITTRLRRRTAPRS